MPARHSRALQEIAGIVTYGWGTVPVDVRIGKTEWYTALWLKDGRYIVPVKASVREAEGLKEGDKVKAGLIVR